MNLIKHITGSRARWKQKHARDKSDGLSVLMTNW